MAQVTFVLGKQILAVTLWIHLSLQIWIMACPETCLLMGTRKIVDFQFVWCFLISIESDKLLELTRNSSR